MKRIICKRNTIIMYLVFLAISLNITVGYSNTVYHPLLIKEVTYNSKQYFIELNKERTTSYIWLRANKDVESPAKDKKLFKVLFSKGTLDEAKSIICRGLNKYEDFEYYAGCAAAVGSAACAFTAGRSGAAPAVMCTIIALYAKDKGLDDCISGSIDKIAEVLGDKNAPIASLNLGRDLKKGHLAEAIKATLHIACDDKNGKPPVTKSTRSAVVPTPNKSENQKRSNGGGHDGVADHKQNPGPQGKAEGPSGKPAGGPAGKSDGGGFHGPITKVKIKPSNKDHMALF